jgi:hypothetical protein
MPGAKRRALKKLLSPHSEAKDAQHQPFPTGTEHSEVEEMAVPTLSHSPVSPNGNAVGREVPGLRDLSVSPLPPAAVSPRSTELQLVDEMQARQNVIGSGHASGLSSSSNSLSPPQGAATPQSAGYTVDDLLNAGTDSKGKKKSSKQRFLEREVSRAWSGVNLRTQTDTSANMFAGKKEGGKGRSSSPSRPRRDEQAGERKARRAGDYRTNVSRARSTAA